MISTIKQSRAKSGIRKCAKVVREGLCSNVTCEKKSPGGKEAMAICGGRQWQAEENDTRAPGHELPGIFQEQGEE